MSYKDKWTLLLSDKRFREKSSTIPSDGRNPFENDYGRLISSAPIRRLQDKTQVFPLEQSDFIRTRLTHSLEVSYIGSSIGQSIEKKLLEKNDLDISLKGNLSSLLRVAGLVHDLGNPPFGHFGEEAVKTFFQDFFANNKTTLKPIEKADFTNFDGNVQTFRILSKLSYFGDQYGYNLTFSSLASIVKYPSNSVEGNLGKDSAEIAKKKFGYFQSEQKKYKTINTQLQLGNRRHPVVYLLEAADDIAYSAADIEDGVKLGIINFYDIRKIFENHLTNNKEGVLKKMDFLIEKFREDSESENLMIQQFRIFTQQLMIEGVVNAFEEHYEKIMNGTLEAEIIDVSNAADVRKAYKKLQSRVFSDKNIIKKEIAGWEAVYGLLRIFCEEAKSPNFTISGNTRENRFYKIIASSHRKVFEEIEEYNNEEYKKLQLIVDFISGMTDSYAISLFQELSGIKV
ncbi:MAG: deoxyguanosinetriphosphate triphosphohydrolase [Bacteroidetes bacterium HGW-Bacteroidetes-2]|jgi:dGTPase|nr:MAG: deoxyguanosinetriphosphate triphosphohydrolase [Bacteroidetes bacterium HGW-Bacteroidetes-8]PKP26724.1 MAG: deoxyguanosinetriphosphate triphosphohydrolase [Bacteroidetes bacterium HGW-Bacteroidetes-2]